MTRTTGYDRTNIVYVDEGGCIYNRGIQVNCPDNAILPAVILDLDSDIYISLDTASVGG